MDKKIISKEYSKLKRSRHIDKSYFDQRENEYNEFKEKNIEDNSTIKEHKCVNCGSNKVEMANNSKYFDSSTDLNAKMVKFYCRRCNCHFYLSWEDLRS